MKILIVKKGALGDVVRTAFLLKGFYDKYQGKVEIFWYTSNEGINLLRFNPYVTSISANLSVFESLFFDLVCSLDDENDILLEVKKLKFKELIGAYIDSQSCVTYCERSSYWFDMGLLSKFGKSRADDLKKRNKLSHGEIFKKIFGLGNLEYKFYNSPIIESKYLEYFKSLKQNGITLIGVNPFAGGRWSSKELRKSELLKLIRLLQDRFNSSQGCRIFLFGAQKDYIRNIDLVESNGLDQNIIPLNTDSSVMELAGVINCMDFVISSDSLALHLSIGLAKPVVCFFAPTSAAEIPNLKTIKKVISKSKEYCNYQAQSNNESITAERIFNKFLELI
jgi:heptosyltransferase-2